MNFSKENVHNGESSQPKKHEWVRLWLAYLYSNRNYQNYCIAIRNDVSSEKVKLENIYPKISQIFQDWGDIYKNFRNQSELDARVSSYYQLFFPEPEKVMTIESGFVMKNATAIVIPHSIGTKEAVGEVKRILSERPCLEPHKKLNPKYRFHPNGYLQQPQVDALRKTLLVHTLAMLKEPGTEKPLSNSTIAILLTRLDSLGFSWELTKRERDRLINNELKRSEFEDNARQVKRYRKHAQILIENTLRGLFPCKVRIK